MRTRRDAGAAGRSQLPRLPTSTGNSIKANEHPLGHPSKYLVDSYSIRESASAIPRLSAAASSKLRPLQGSDTTLKSTTAGGRWKHTSDDTVFLAMHDGRQLRAGKVPSKGLASSASLRSLSESTSGALKPLPPHKAPASSRSIQRAVSPLTSGQVRASSLQALRPLAHPPAERRATKPDALRGAPGGNDSTMQLPPAAFSALTSAPHDGGDSQALLEALLAAAGQLTPRRLRRLLAQARSLTGTTSSDSMDASGSPAVVSPTPAVQQPPKPATAGSSGEQLHLNIFSTHSDAETPMWLGLTEIQVYAALPSVMPLALAPHALSMSGAALQPPRSAAGRAAARRLPRLCNGAFKTASEDDMFLAQLRPVASHSTEPLLTVSLQLPPAAAPPRAVVLWNWNCPHKAEDGSSLMWGARLASLTDSRGHELWRGELPCGTGDAHTQTGLSIPLSSKLASAALGASSNRVNTVKAPKDTSADSATPPPRSPGSPLLSPQEGGGSSPSTQSGSASTSIHDSDSDSPDEELIPTASILPAQVAHRGLPLDGSLALETSLEHLQQFALKQPGRLALPDESARRSPPVYIAGSTDSSSPTAGTEHPILQNDARPQSAASVAASDTGQQPAGRPKVESELQLTAVPCGDSSSGGHDDGGAGWASEPLGAASQQELEDSLSTSFALVPHCPRVTQLQLQLLSTWGDPHLVGLAGIQVFDANGALLDLCPDVDPRADADGVLTAQPAGVQDMPGFESDPRTIANLLDGQYTSMDELRTWLAPFDPAQPVTLTLRLRQETAIGCIRVWNYNINRAHNTRGVKRLRIVADGKSVFCTRVRQAPGIRADASQLSETVLFTMDKAAVQRIHKHDLSLGVALSSQPQDGTDGVVWRALRRMAADRPSTAEKGDDLLSQAEAALNGEDLQFQTPPRYRRRRDGAARVDSTGAELTLHLPAEGVAAAGAPAIQQATPLLSPSANLMSPAARAAAAVAHAGQAAVTPQVTSTPPGANLTCFDRARGGIGLPYGGGTVPHGRVLDMWIVDTHGDPWYVGLTGIAVLTLDREGCVQPVQLKLEQIMAQPCDINTEGHLGDDRTLDKLVDGVNVTQDDTHMWLIPYTAPPSDAAGRPLGEGGRVNDGEHLLRIDLGSSMPVVGIMVWNYNKHSEGWQRGARRVYLTLDGDHIAPPAQSPSTAYCGDTCVWLRRAPDCADWDYAQVIRFGARRVAPHGALQACVLDDGAAGAAAGHTWAWLDAGGADQRLLKKASSVPGMLPGQLMAGFNVSPNPCGSLLQLKLLSTHGDSFYVGLHDVALLDAAGRRVRVSPLHLHATPSAAACVAPSDARQVGNLSFLPTEAAGSVPLHSSLRPASKSAEAWLAPYARSLGCVEENCVSFALDQPVAFGGVVVYNYGKTPERGAAAYELWLDGNLLVCGQLLRGDAAQDKPLAQIIAFNSDVPKAVSSAVGSFGGASIVLTSRDALQATGQTGTGVVRCVDEGRVVEAGATRTAAHPSLGMRPTTAIAR